MISHIDSTKFVQYMSRPDIRGMRWHITYYQKHAVLPGLWYVAIRENERVNEHDTRESIRSQIYDQEGELVWSGSSKLGGYNAEDLEVSNVNGINILTNVFVGEYDKIILNSDKEADEQLRIGLGDTNNIQISSSLGNSTLSQMTTEKLLPALSEELMSVGYKNECKVKFPGFEVRDARSTQLQFKWNAQGHIELSESLVQVDCSKPWDYVSASSIDVFPDGDFLFTGLHTATMYKISARDGAIIWRFGGKFNDFKFPNHLSGPQNATVRAQNSTHTVISVLDGAMKTGLPWSPNSHPRGMVIVLRTDLQPMTAEVVHIYNCPHTELGSGEGDLQMLENGNVFIAWRRQSLLSEYSEDGDLLMKASWMADSSFYRAVKFNRTALPSQPPDVYAETVEYRFISGVASGSAQTRVFVSWNGATEVESWAFCKTNIDGTSEELMGVVKRGGFETFLIYDGPAKHVIVQAFDRNGNLLGQSNVVTTVDMVGSALLRGISYDTWTLFRRLDNQVMFLMGFSACAVLIFLLGTRFRQRLRAVCRRWRFL